jgi:hypothetical protein
MIKLKQRKYSHLSVSFYIIGLSIFSFFGIGNIEGEILSGTVINKINCNPIPGAKITVLELSSSTITNTLGIYSFGNLPAGDYNVRAESDGFVMKEKSITLTASNPQLHVNVNALDFGELPVGKTATLSFEITNTGDGTLTGTITDDKDWITVDPLNFINNTTVNVTVDNNKLNQSEGQHKGTVIITSNGGIATIEIVLTATCVLVKPNPYNPDRGLLTFFGSGIVPGETTIKIYTLSGELVKTLYSSIEPDVNLHDNGLNEIVWDGNDAQNKPVVDGIYIYVYQSPNEKGIGKFTVLRKK